MPAVWGGRQKALLDKSLPGGAALFDEVRLSRAGQEGAADFLIGLLPRISFFGFSIDLSDLLDPDRAPAVADNQLEQLINMPAGDLVESGDVASRLTPGIETRITGTAPLTMRVAIVNNSDADFVFVPTQYAAEAQRRVQRVTLAPPERVSISAL
ncbi:hypothetical protein LJB82_00720 [Desulfovibrio sp. OttesenSCG-928-M16]|nr:hypothetical protein [Desulfovibrio sp. OttesenSCG-928-M16]